MKMNNDLNVSDEALEKRIEEEKAKPRDVRDISVIRFLIELHVMRALDKMNKEQRSQEKARLESLLEQARYYEMQHYLALGAMIAATVINAICVIRHLL
jgi:hypothetical protein